MQIQMFSLGPIGTNCYIIHKESDCVIFDPSQEAPTIKAYIDDHNLTPHAIFLTHAHFDHIGALDEVRKEYAVDVYLHESEADWLADATLNRSHYALNGAGITTNPPEHYAISDSYTFGTIEFEAVHTPGHSPGSMTYIFQEQELIISGDVLFHHGIGRTDLPGGDIDLLADSIVNKLYTLPDHFEVYPGHGFHTTIGEEKQSNPFTLQFYRE